MKEIRKYRKNDEEIEKKKKKDRERKTEMKNMKWK